MMGSRKSKHKPKYRLAQLCATLHAGSKPTVKELAARDARGHARTNGNGHVRHANDNGAHAVVPKPIIKHVNPMPVVAGAHTGEPVPMTEPMSAGEVFDQIAVTLGTDEVLNRLVAVLR
jgi:hypothetical protein